MTDRLQKNLNKLTEKEKQKIKKILLLIKAGNLSGLDVKKLKNHQDIFRVRKGGLRIIFKNSNAGIFILTVERRCKTIYDF
jgi:mRNA-degrading endonuclease RelE of RelBE toxin-antitoxin system